MTGPSLFIHHSTSQPIHFFGRAPELTLLDDALAPDGPSVVAFLGPGGQGKTAIVQHWLEQWVAGKRQADGVFLWSFYRGKDADLCLRELYAPRGRPGPAARCIRHLLRRSSPALPAGSGGCWCSTAPRWPSTRPDHGSGALSIPSWVVCWKSWLESPFLEWWC